MPGRHGADRQGRREQKSREAAEAERAAQVARAERRLAQATGSLPRDGASSRPARTPTPPDGTEAPRQASPPVPPAASRPAPPPVRPVPTRPATPPARPARYVGPPLAPAPREPLPISADLYVEETPTDGFPPVGTERTLPPGTWMSFRG